MKKTLLEMYQELPEAGQVPDNLWDAHRLLEEIEECTKKQSSLQKELEETMVKVMGYLHVYWSDEELLKVGLMTLLPHTEQGGEGREVSNDK